MEISLATRQKIPRHIFRGGRWWVNVVAWVAVVIAALLFFNQPLGKAISSTWSGISPLWGLVPMGIAALIGLTEGYYQHARDLEGRLDTAQKRLQGEAERRTRLRTARELNGETFYVWELFDPDARPVVINRTFIDCVIVGPALITPVNCRINHNILGAPLEERLYLATPPTTRVGIFGFGNCDFVRCDFQRIGFYGGNEFLNDLRKSPAI